MFGYVKPFKPYMRMCEFDTYKCIYCGFCKAMGRHFGLVSRFTLSYDFVFLCLVNMSVNENRITASRQRCIAHPLVKKPCADANEGFDFPAYAAMILIYHKLKDDFCDDGIKGKLKAGALLPFFVRKYKKAREKYPELAENIEKLMKYQKQIENEKCDNIDKACEPTAKMMQSMASYITDDNEKKQYMESFCYQLGRYIYLVDALDDVRKDYKKSEYNPLLFRLNGAELDDNEFQKLAQFVNDNVLMSLGVLSDAYVKLDLKMYKPILDNIIYLGLKNVFEQVRTEKFMRKSKKERKIYNE